MWKVPPGSSTSFSYSRGPHPCRSSWPTSGCDAIQSNTARTHHFSLPESVPTDAQPAVPVADLSRHRGDGPTEGRQADTADVKYMTADRAEG